MRAAIQLASVTNLLLRRDRLFGRGVKAGTMA